MNSVNSMQSQVSEFSWRKYYFQNLFKSTIILWSYFVKFIRKYISNSDRIIQNFKFCNRGIHSVRSLTPEPLSPRSINPNDDVGEDYDPPSLIRTSSNANTTAAVRHTSEPEPASPRLTTDFSGFRLTRPPPLPAHNLGITTRRGTTFSSHFFFYILQNHSFWILIFYHFTVPPLNWQQLILPQNKIVHSSSQSTNESTEDSTEDRINRTL